MDDEGCLVWLAIIAIFLIFIFVVIGDKADKKKWEQFKTQHHCKIVAHIKGDITPGVGVSSSGKAVVTANLNSDKDGWLCDDGITYYRDN